MTEIRQGDALTVLKTFPSESVHCCVTSPPYWGLRDYGVEGQIGLEKTPEEYVAKMVEVFREVKRVLRDDGTLWLNLGDSYWGSGKGSGHDEYTLNLGRSTLSYGGDIRNHSLGKHPILKPKDLVGIPWRVAFALQQDGWYLRSDIIWHKPNPMPESVKDRPTKSHEYVFLLSKNAKYYFDQDAVREDATYKERWGKHTKIYNESQKEGLDKSYDNRNIRTVWTIATQPQPEAHFATFPEALVIKCILAGTSERGCCPGCGKPWERITQREGLSSRDWQKIRGTGTKGFDEKTGIQGKSIAGGRPPDPTYTTVGWQPTCKCGKYTCNTCSTFDPIPCTVLDCFSGTNTTGRVAKKLNRQFIAIELNPKYIEIAEWVYEREVGLLI